MRTHHPLQGCAPVFPFSFCGGLKWEPSNVSHWGNISVGCPHAMSAQTDLIGEKGMQSSGTVALFLGCARACHRIVRLIYSVYPSSPNGGSQK